MDTLAVGPARIYCNPNLERKQWNWKIHQMKTFSALLALFCGEFTGDRWILLTKANDAELWCFLWARDAGDWGRHRAHHDVTVIYCAKFVVTGGATIYRQDILMTIFLSLITGGESIHCNVYIKQPMYYFVSKNRCSLVAGKMNMVL